MGGFAVELAGDGPNFRASDYEKTRTDVAAGFRRIVAADIRASPPDQHRCCGSDGRNRELPRLYADRDRFDKYAFDRGAMASHFVFGWLADAQRKQSSFRASGVEVVDSGRSDNLPVRGSQAILSQSRAGPKPFWLG